MNFCTSMRLKNAKRTPPKKMEIPSMWSHGAGAADMEPPRVVDCSSMNTMVLCGEVAVDVRDPRLNHKFVPLDFRRSMRALLRNRPARLLALRGSIAVKMSSEVL